MSSEVKGFSEVDLRMINADGVDPLVIAMKGTFSGEKPYTSEELNTLSKLYNDEVKQVFWSGDNTKQARTEGANNIKLAVDNHLFADNETLSLIGHSHAGNVFKEFSNGGEYGGVTYKNVINEILNTLSSNQNYNQPANYTPKQPKTIDSVVQLGTPNREDYSYNNKAFSDNATKINVFDRNDGVQTRGYVDGGYDKTVTGIIGFFTPPKNIQQLDGFQNIEINQTKPTYIDTPFLGPRIENIPLDPIESHSGLNTPEVPT